MPSCNARVGFLFVAHMSLKFTGVSLIAPMRYIVLFSSARRSARCPCSLKSATSSRKSVPWCAISIFPFFPVLAAPVNEFWSWPKSSASRRLSVSPAQFTAMYGLFARVLCLWISCAVISLPTPVSPVMRML